MKTFLLYCIFGLTAFPLLGQRMVSPSQELEEPFEPRFVRPVLETTPDPEFGLESNLRLFSISFQEVALAGQFDSFAWYPERDENGIVFRYREAPELRVHLAAFDSDPYNPMQGGGQGLLNLLHLSGCLSIDYDPNFPEPFEIDEHVSVKPSNRFRFLTFEVDALMDVRGVTNVRHKLWAMRTGQPVFPQTTIIHVRCPEIDDGQLFAKGLAFARQIRLAR